jgi:hypothetical protein
MSIEAIKQWLEALKSCSGVPHWRVLQPIIKELEQAIAEAEKQEWESVLIDGVAYTVPMEVACELLRLHLLVQQPKREWVELTDEEIEQGLLRSDYALQTAHAWRAGVVFAMTQLKEKNR